MLALAQVTVWYWVAFTIVVLVLLGLDLGVFHSRSKIVSFKEALVWTGIWFLLALLFHACFSGFSETSSEGTPPWHGSWWPPGADRPIVDRHTLMVLYSPQIEEAKDFFRRLRWILEQDEEANQDVVLGASGRVPMNYRQRFRLWNPPARG